VDQGQPIEDLCPDGSYVIPFQKLNKDTFDKQVDSCYTLWDIPADSFYTMHAHTVLIIHQRQVSAMTTDRQECFGTRVCIMKPPVQQM
jgi:hypothetical protein